MNTTFLPQHALRVDLLSATRRRSHRDVSPGGSLLVRSPAGNRVYLQNEITDNHSQTGLEYPRAAALGISGKENSS